MEQKEEKTIEIQACLDEQQKQSKKRKMNQRKKRQRIEKKKRQNQFQNENSCNEYDDFNCEYITQNEDCNKFMSKEQLELLRQQEFDPQEFIEDEQLLILIQQYDPAMNQSDIEYLMQLEDREAVINTLYAKLMEREHLQLQLIDENNRNDTDFQEEEEEEYDSQENQYTTYPQQINKDINQLSPLQFHSQYSNTNQYNFLEVQNNNNSKSDLKNQKSKQKSQINTFTKDKKQQGLVNLNSFKIKNKQKFLNSQSKNELQQISNFKNNSGSLKNENKEDQMIDEESYDLEFEKSLQDFYKKLQSKKECSLQRIYCQQQFKTNGSVGTHSRKLIPNVSSEWIHILKSQLNFKKSSVIQRQGIQKQGQYQNTSRFENCKQAKVHDSQI